MSVRKTTNNDKQAVLEFCKNTFSWGDYIADVWDSWIDEGNFLIIHENKLPVAICHASLYKDGKQVWIEGIRVNEHFRRKGHASKLVKESEKIGKQNGCDTAYMLITSTNKESLELARKLNYAIFETWYFYSLEPKKVDSIQNIKFASYEKKSPSIIFTSNFFYVNSWRWLPLDNNTKLTLIKEKRIIYVDKDDVPDSVAVISNSKYFHDTMIVTIFSVSDNTINAIFSYIQNFAYNKSYKRIQILTKIKSLPDYTGLEKRFKFNLMKKKI